MQQQYVQLIDSFCKLVGVKELADIAAVVDGAAIDIDDIRFTFAYHAISAPNRLMVFCDLGEVPEQHKTKVYRALLETNLYLYEADAAVYSIMPESGRALCATRFMLDQLKVEELRSIVTLLAQRAHDWRRSHFDAALARRDVPLSSKSSVAAGLRSQLRTRT